jgi:hypothetical protein
MNSMKANCRSELSNISLGELWAEIGRRLNLKFGKVQMCYHNGKPSQYANVDLKIKTDTEEEVAS